MTVIETIENRRSIRKYSSKPIEQGKLDKVLEAARLAPSACNGQNWKFIVVTDLEIIHKLMEACGNQKFIGEAPAFIAAVGTKPEIMTNGQPLGAVDVSIALSFMILEACEQGLGTCWIAYYRQDDIRKILNIPEHMSIIGVTPIGYAQESPAARPRKSIDEIVCYNVFE